MWFARLANNSQGKVNRDSLQDLFVKDLKVENVTYQDIDVLFKTHS